MGTTPIGSTNFLGLPFPLGEKRSSDVSELAQLVGQEFTVGKTGMVRLVQLDNASGLSGAAAQARMFMYTATAADDFDVDHTSASTSVCCGISDENQESLDDNDYFFVWILGEEETIKVTKLDAGDLAAGDYIDPDSSGGATDANTTATIRQTACRVLEAVTGGSTNTGRVRIIQKLVG